MFEESHYEVPGDCPSTSFWRIELVCKGQRSQCYSGCYAGVDETARARAAAGMQALNNAYSFFNHREK